MLDTMTDKVQMEEDWQVDMSYGHQGLHSLHSCYYCQQRTTNHSIISITQTMDCILVLI